MVRHSYIVCVEELEGLNIYDVLLVDSDFDVQWHALAGLRRDIDVGDKSRHHFFTISNAERTFKLGSESDKKMMQFIQSIQRMKESSPWAKPHRFDSFAPVRYNVQAQWLVDGVHSQSCNFLTAARLLLECESCNSQGEGRHLSP
jgi:phospholipase D1/2